MIGKRIRALWVQGAGTDAEKHFDVSGIIVDAARGRQHQWSEMHWWLLVVDDGGKFHDVRADFATLIANPEPGPYR